MSGFDYRKYIDMVEAMDFQMDSKKVKLLITIMKSYILFRLTNNANFSADKIAMIVQRERQYGDAKQVFSIIADMFKIDPASPNFSIIYDTIDAVVERAVRDDFAYKHGIFTHDDMIPQDLLMLLKSNPELLTEFVLYLKDHIDRNLL